MRRAAAERVWRHVADDRGLHVTRIVSNAISPLASIDDDLPNGLVVLCGLNGVGKTSILRLVQATLNGADTVHRGRRNLLVPGQFSLEINTEGEPTRITLGDEQGSVSAIVLDAFQLCSRALQLTSQPNYEDVFVGIEPHIFSDKELQDANYVIGASYSGVEMLEVEEPGSEEAAILALPRVSRAAETYTFSELGTGELAALSLLWQVWRADPGSVVLIEEPESFLSSRASAAFMDVLAAQITARKLYAIVTTHSTDVVSRTPVANIRVLIRTPDGAHLRKPESHAELELLLGSFTGQARVVFVEDKLAAIFVGELLGRFRGLWGEAVEVVGVGGEANVKGACRTLPKVASLLVCGVVDGDQRGAVEPANEGWPIVVLPGDDDPGELMRRAAESNSALFSERLGRRQADVDAAIHLAEPTEAHDWFAELSDMFTLTETAVIRASMECWLSDEDNSAAAQDVANAIAAALAGHV